MYEQKHLFGISVQADFEKKIIENFIEGKEIIYYELIRDDKFITYLYSIPMDSSLERKIREYLKYNTNFTIFPFVFALRKDRYKIKEIKPSTLFVVEDKIKIEDIEIVYNFYKNKLDNFFSSVISNIINSEFDFIILKYGLGFQKDIFYNFENKKTEVIKEIETFLNFKINENKIEESIKILENFLKN
ncbi:MAG: hypothetical protein QXQ30_00545 [Candidatus Pacearchaeota archaeon]